MVFSLLYIEILNLDSSTWDFIYQLLSSHSKVAQLSRAVKLVLYKCLRVEYSSSNDN